MLGNRQTQTRRGSRLATGLRSDGVTGYVTRYNVVKEAAEMQLGLMSTTEQHQ